MKKYAILFLALLLAVVCSAPANAGNPWSTTAVLTGGVVTDNTHSAAVTLPKNVTRIGIVVPTLTSAAVNLEVSNDGTTYYNLYCQDNGTNSILWSTAASTGVYAVVVPCEMYLWKYLKVETGAAQAADRTFTIYGVGGVPVDIR